MIEPRPRSDRAVWNSRIEAAPPSNACPTLDTTSRPPNVPIRAFMSSVVAEEVDRVAEDPQSR
jgi:hypothetical protein